MHDFDEEAALKALSHGVRVQILDALYAAGEASPSAISRQIGESVETVSYHFRLLEGWQLVERVRQEQLGQRRINIYRLATAAGPTLAAWRSLPEGAQRAVDARRLRAIAGLAAGVAARDDPSTIHRLGVLGVLLDDEGVRAAQDAMDRFVAEMRAVETAARDRQADGGVDCKLVLMLLSAVDEPDAGSPAPVDAS